MNSQNSVESELLANPSTLWAETERLSKAYQAAMTRIRYKAFSALWKDGKKLREIAGILGIPEGHCSVVQMRARSALGVEGVPYRNCSRGQSAKNREFIQNHPKMSVADLAKLLGVTQTTVYNQRAGK